MVRFVRYFFVFTVLFLTAANAVPKFSHEGVTDDFRAMLANPRGPAKPTDSFATLVTRPHMVSMTDMDFFSDPQNSRGKWNREYKSHTGRDKITVLGIFETMGTSRRGILNASLPGAIFMTTEQQTGMLRIITGGLGFRKKAATEAEKDVMARELLNMGRSMGVAGIASSDDVGHFKHLSRGGFPNIKRHAQMSTLLMLVGAGYSRFEEELTWSWCFDGMGDKQAALAKIKGYADRFLPRDDAALVAPKDVVISALTYNGRAQSIYGTSGIKVSGLHAAVDYGRYPDVMILGSHKVPMQAVHQVFSITAEVAPGRYVVIMEPEVGDDPVLRPQYMEVKAGDPTTAQGAGQTRVAVKHTGKAEQNVTIDWTVDAPKASSGVLPSAIAGLGAYMGSRVSEVKPTERGPNDGSVNPVVIENEFGEKSYSFVARVLGAKEKRFFYWCPTPSQLGLLKDFAGQKKRFTFGELYDHLGTFGDDAVDPRILREIQEIKEGTLGGFSK